MSDQVRVRFAPSPTGYLHVGGARTALFNWLYARHTGGKFVLRIEDTDQARNTQEAVRVIIDGMRWLGLDWDEGPEVGGDRGPYFQSERDAIYTRYFEKLKAADLVYEDGGAWRFRFARELVELDDLVCGRVPFDFANVETSPDMTIRRPDGTWIFHFTNVVDDIEMGITHVIRGEDHLSNTPKHLQLYRALGAKAPAFAHVPLILNRDGTKMSKRDQGASLTTYMEEGYLPAAVCNYLCLLGWNPKNNREVMPIEEVIAMFDPANINRKAAQFDLEKCLWLNAEYLKRMSLQEYREAAKPFLAKAGIECPSEAALDGVLALEKEKVKLLSEVPNRVSFFFTEEYEFTPEAEAKLRAPGAIERLEQMRAAFDGVNPWAVESLEAVLKETAAAHGVKAGEFVHPVRAAVSGRTAGPSLYHMLEALGRERTLGRMDRALRNYRG